MRQSPWKVWNSHKFKRSAYRYEIALCIATGEIVWTNGAFPAGAYPDISIFRRGLKQLLRQANEKAQADLGYRGEHGTIILPNPCDSFAVAKLKKDLRSRHETVNQRYKQFGVLRQTFRHDLSKHKSVFDAVTVLVQLSIRNGEPLYQVQYGHLPNQLWRNRRV